jgi:hypothetical protein
MSKGAEAATFPCFSEKSVNVKIALNIFFHVRITDAEYYNSAFCTQTAPRMFNKNKCFDIIQVK